MKTPDTFPGRSWEKEVSSGDLFLTGLFMMAAFLVNPSTLLRVVQFLFFWFYAYWRGKRNRPLITLSVMGGIVLFNLLVPYGRVLAAFGAFRITQGALLGGLHKALTLEGLILLSKASIRADLCVPGFFGSLLGESFRIFEGITQRKALITRKHFIEGIDQLMLELSAEQALRAEQRGSSRVYTKPRRTLAGMLLLGGAAVPIWGLTLLGLRFGRIF
jgi:heptaprenyl diphosphate synthase